MHAPLPDRDYSRADVGHDGFAAALINGLTQHPDQAHVWGATRTVLWSVLTLGIGPAILWTLRFAESARAERELLTRLADWMRFHSIHSEAGLLRGAEDALTPRPFLSALPVVLCGAVVAVFGFYASNHGWSLEQVLDRTYWFPVRQLRPRPNTAARLFALWNLGVTLAYVIHWLQVTLHRADVDRFVSRVNRVLMAEGLGPVAVAQQPPKRWVRWVVAAGLLLMYLNAAWAIFAMAAAASQNRYATTTGPAVRKALASRVREMLLAHAPGGQTTLRCHRERCRAPVMAGSRFCRRCGTQVHGALPAILA